MSREFATGGPLGATFVSDTGNRDFMLSTTFLGREPAVVVYGMKAWTGSEWATKPVKVWTGSGWATKPVRHWDGTKWVPEPPVLGGVITITAVGPGSWTVPAGIGKITKLETWGAGGGGYGGGGSGGAYARIENLTVTPGQIVYYNNSAGGIGGTSQPTDVWARLGTNAPPTTTADGALADSGQNAHSADFVGMPGGQASASIGTTKYSGGTAGNSNAVDSGGGGGGAAGDHMNGGNAINAGSNHTGGFGGDDGGGDGGHGDINGTQLQNGFAPGGGGGGSWVGTDANGAPGQILITYASAPAATGPTTHIVSYFAGNFARADYTGDVGFMFRPTADMTITWIGRYATADNWGPATVNLYRFFDQSLLRTATVDMAGKAEGEWSWTSVAPVALTAGVDYVLVEAVVHSAGQSWCEMAATTVPLCTNVNSIYRSGGGGFNTAGVGQQYVGLDLGW